MRKSFLIKINIVTEIFFIAVMKNIVLLLTSIYIDTYGARTTEFIRGTFFAVTNFLFNYGRFFFDKVLSLRRRVMCEKFTFPLECREKCSFKLNSNSISRDKINSVTNEAAWKINHLIFSSSGLER